MLAQIDFEQIHFVLHLNLSKAIVNSTKKQTQKFHRYKFDLIFFLTAERNTEYPVILWL